MDESELHNVIPDEIDEDFISWTDVLNLTDIEKCDSNRIDTLSKSTHEFKGLHWDILYRTDITTYQKLPLWYIGFAKSDYSFQLLHARYQYILLGKDNEILHSSYVSNLELGDAVTKEAADRFDRGGTVIFDFQTLLRFSYTLDDADSPKFIKVRILIEEMFVPSAVPRGRAYNSKSVTGMVGLDNLGATCYLNALLQMLYHVNQFRQSVYRMPCTELGPTSTPLALQGVFRELQTSEKSVSTDTLLKAFGWTSQDAFMQQDVQEMMRVLLDKIEENMKGTVVEGVVNKLFSGKVSSFIRCINVDYESRRLEDFYDIQLDVKGCKNVLDSFRKYTEKEVLSGDNQYDAEALGKQDAEKGIIFQSFPPVLTIHLKRFDFDYERMGFTKIHDLYEFPTRLCLDEFLAPDSPQRLAGESQTFILHSVLVHQGDVGGGHYYAYIRPTTSYFSYSSSAPQTRENIDPEIDSEWFKFNDDIVSAATEREAIQYCFGQKPSRFLNDVVSDSMSSAYMLVYILESQAANIMAPVSTTDIPDGLNRRLNFSRIQRSLSDTKFKALKVRTDVFYVLEEDVRNFSNYSKSSDFIDMDNVPKTRCINIPCYLTSTLTLAILLSKQLKVDLPLIRLWRFSGTSMLCRASIPVAISAATSIQRYKDSEFEYYVEILDPSTILLDADQDNYFDHLTEFQSEFNSLSDSALVIHDNLLKEIAVAVYEKLDEVRVDIDDQDTIQICEKTLYDMMPMDDLKGMLSSLQLGTTTEYLERYIFKDRELFSTINVGAFQNDMNDINYQVVKLLSGIAIESGRNVYDPDFKNSISSDIDYLLFIRVFDPNGELQLTDEIDENGSDQMEVESEQSESSEKCPITYLKSIRVLGALPFSHVVNQIKEFIRNEYPHLSGISHWQSCFQDDIASDEDDNNVDNDEDKSNGGKSLRIWRVDDPETLVDITDSWDTLVFKLFKNGDILIVDPDKSQTKNKLVNSQLSTSSQNTTASTSALLPVRSPIRMNSNGNTGPINALTQYMENAKEWFLFLANKVQIRFIACNDLAKNLYVDRFRAIRKFKSQRKLLKRANKRARILHTTAIDSGSGSGDSNSGGNGKNVVDQKEDENYSSDLHSDSDDSSVQLGQFQCEFHLNQNFSAVFDTIADRLGLPSNSGSHIVVFAAQANNGKPITNSIAFRNDTVSIQEGFNTAWKSWSRELSEKTVFYQVIPLEMHYSNKHEFEQTASKHWRYADIAIGDKRVLYWRRLCIQQYITRLLNEFTTDSIDFYTLTLSRLLHPYVDRVQHGTISSDLLDGLEDEYLTCVNWPNEQLLTNVPVQLLSEFVVYYPLHTADKVGEQMKQIRELVGLPMDVDGNGCCGMLAPSTDLPPRISLDMHTFPHTHSTSPTAIPTEGIVRINNPVTIASNQLKTWLRCDEINFSAIEKRNFFNYCRHILQTEFSIDNPEKEMSAFPLSLLILRYDKVSKVVTFNSAGSVAPLSFMDSPSKSYAPPLLLQHISTLDVAYMMNVFSSATSNDIEIVSTDGMIEENRSSTPISTSPDIYPLKSLGISVYLITVISGVNRYESLYPEKGSTPFLTYVTENDTYESLCARLDIFLTSIDWNKARLILLHDSSSVILPKNKLQQIPNSTPLSARSDVMGINIGESATRAPTPMSAAGFTLQSNGSVPVTPAAITTEPKPLWDLFVAMYERVQPQYPPRTRIIPMPDSAIGPQLPPSEQVQKPLFLELGVQIIGNNTSKRSRGIKIT